MSADASDLREVTEGESLDLHPSWAADGTERIAYQSAGLGRDASGRAAGFGRFEIHVLDLERGALDTLAADPAADLERPRLGPDGALYYLSRPRSAPAGSVLRMAKATGAAIFRVGSSGRPARLCDAEAVDAVLAF